MKIAWFSPLNPMPSGIADYCEELLPSLARHAEIDLYHDPAFKPDNPAILEAFRTIPFDADAFRPGDYDAVVYHMGNEYSVHRFVYDALRRFPGVVVLHDYVLMGFYAARQNAGHEFPAFIRFLQEFYPDKSEWIGKYFDGRYPFALWEEETAFHLPMNEEICRLATGIIVHSDYVLSKLPLDGKPAAVIPHHGHHLRSVDREAVRKELGVGPDRILLLSTGYVTSNKRYELVIDVLKELGRPDISYLIAGRDSGGFLKKIPDAGGAGLMIRGFAPLEKMESWIAAADIGINLRNPTMGESSGSLMRMMSYGLPVIVSDTGSYREIPDPCVVKIDTDMDEKEMLKAFIRVLADDPALRAAVGREAADYAGIECAMDRCADRYAEFLLGMKKKRPALEETS